MSQGDGPVALVSAGSGGIGGIGAAIVRRLAAAGWDVSFGYDGDEHSAREAEWPAGAQSARVTAVAREAERPAGAQSARVTAVRVDLTDSAAVAAWVRRAGEELGQVEAAVSCAGIIADRPPALIRPADWRVVADLDGMFHLCRAAVPVMMRQRSGRIVMVSSVVGVYGHVGDDLAPKPGIAGFVRALASQVGRFGIQVNAVAPGPAGREMTAVVPERTHASVTETIALRRFSSAAAVADLVAGLLSAETPQVSGTVLEVSSPILA